MGFLQDALGTASKVASPVASKVASGAGHIGSGIGSSLSAGLGALAPLAYMAFSPNSAAKGVKAEGPGVGETQPGEAPKAAPPPSAGAAAEHYHSPYNGAFMAGIGTGEEGAQRADRNVNGRGPGYGYAAYEPSPTDADAQLEATASVGPFSHTFSKDVTIPYGAMDTVGDVAAVTQYAAAADQGVQVDRGPDGKPEVNIDWQKLSETPIQANYDFQTHGHDLPGAKKINYDNPTKVAENGQQAIFDNLKASGKDPKDKEQFISITGHSGGGQSSFYTALKMASEGYKNVSVVGVDMAMTPHQREALKALGVDVTNITSHNKDEDGQHTSEVGEFIQVGMGGGDNYYDMNVERQHDTDPAGRHGIDNDANVTTMVRFAQYLDANGQHGKYSPENYKEFLADNPGGNVLSPDGTSGPGQTADRNLLEKVQDNRNKSGPEARTEQDFNRWFGGFTTALGKEVLPLPDGDYGLGPVHINPRDWAAEHLGDLAGSNPGAVMGLLQQTGIDTSHIAGLEQYNGGNVSNHWGQLNPIDIPLPDWLDIQSR